jgi:hypothetical protein
VENALGKVPKVLGSIPKVLGSILNLYPTK